MRSRVYDTITWNAKSSHDKNNASSIYNTELKNINPWKQPDKKKINQHNKYTTYRIH